MDADGEPTGRTEPADPEDLSLVASGASNLGPTNEDLLATVAERVAAYRVLNSLGSGTRVPVDAVTASGSGLDPHISVVNARLQARRVARERSMSRQMSCALPTDTRRAGRSGSWARRGVNVLEPDPSQPRYLITEPGMGYRFVPGASTSGGRREHGRWQRAVAERPSPVRRRGVGPGPRESSSLSREWRSLLRLGAI